MDGTSEGPTFGPAMTGAARRRWPWIVAGVTLVLLLGATGAVAGATVSYADGLEGRLLPGTFIAGVDVGRMTQDEALRAVTAATAGQLERVITVRFKRRGWSATARELGARSDAERVVAEVAAAQQGLTWPQWALLRWTGRSAAASADVRITRRGGGVQRFVAAVARDVQRPPRDADVKVRKGKLRVTDARPGYRLDRARLAQRVRAALDGSQDLVRAPVRRKAAKVRARDFRQVLHLDQSEHRLTLFLRGRRKAAWTVATGTGEYPTPLGRFEVSQKRYLPTWVNPDPTGWGADMPASIPPGPGNPLGLRALNWSAPGAIRFHGTSDVGSLGTSASHGCVRMANSDVVVLYDLVKVGAVILSEP